MAKAEMQAKLHPDNKVCVSFSKNPVGESPLAFQRHDMQS